MTVKNLQAFQVLQNVFHKASNPVLCTKVLSAIRTMWVWNARNFFLLEWTLQPISQFVEIVPLKPAPVQKQFFQLLEALVFELHYVPHEILRKVQCLIKESPESPCARVALQSVLRIAGRDLLFTDIFRDSGLLGLLLAQLRKRAKILRKSGDSQERREGWREQAGRAGATPPPINITEKSERPQVTQQHESRRRSLGACGFEGQAASLFAITGLIFPMKRPEGWAEL